MNDFREKAACTAIGFILMGWLIPALSCALGASDPNTEKKTSLPWLPGPDTQARQELKEGLQAAQEGRWPVAIGRFKAAHERSFVWPPALFNLGWSCDKAGGQPLRAAIWYRAYLAARPEASDAPAVRRRINALLADTEQAISRIMGMEEEVCRTVPAKDSGGARLAYADAWLGLDRPDKALEIAKRPDLNLSLYWLIDVARKFAEQGQIGRARESAQYLRGTETWDHSNSGFAFGAIAEVQAKTGDIEGALKTLEEITSAGREGAFKAIAGAYLTKGDLAGCQSLMTLTSTDYERSLVMSALACGLAERGNTAAALDMVDRMPDSEGICRAMALTAVLRRFYLEKNWHEAQSCSHRAVRELDKTALSHQEKEHFDAACALARLVAEKLKVAWAKEEFVTRYENRYFFRVNPTPWYDLARAAAKKAEDKEAGMDPSMVGYDAAQEAWKILDEVKQRIDPNLLDLHAEEKVLCLRDLTRTLAEKGEASMAWAEVLDWMAAAVEVERDKAYGDLKSLETSAKEDNSRYRLLPVVARDWHLALKRFRQTDRKWNDTDKARLKQ